MTWSTPALIREGVENLVAWRGANLFFGLVFAVSVAGSAVDAGAGEASHQRGEAEFHRRGGHLYVLVQEPPLAASESECHDLASLASVSAAGPVRAAGDIRFTSAPGVAYQHFSGTRSGLRAMLGDRVPATPGLILGELPASELGVSSGSVLATTDGQVLPVHVIQSVAARRQELERAVLSVRPPIGALNECWIDLAPDSGVDGSSIVAALSSSDSPNVAVPAVERAPLSLLRSPRPSNRSPLGFAAGAVLGWVGSVKWRRRRSLFYRLHGGTGVGATMPDAVEGLVVATLGTTVGLAVGILLVIAWFGPYGGAAARAGLLTTSSIALAVTLLAALPHRTSTVEAEIRGD